MIYFTFFWCPIGALCRGPPGPGDQEIWTSVPAINFGRQPEFIFLCLNKRFFSCTFMYVYAYICMDMSARAIKSNEFWHIVANDSDSAQPGSAGNWKFTAHTEKLILAWVYKVFWRISGNCLPIRKLCAHHFGHIVSGPASGKVDFTKVL